MTDTLDHTAQRIADRGRHALLARLRPAFEEAAASHADVLQLSDEQLEPMVQRAADRADGVQWRSALAAVAAEELGISRDEALSHPAVERAQSIVGAPSYEESLKLAATRRPTAPADQVVPADEVAPADEEARTDRRLQTDQEVYEDEELYEDEEAYQDEQNTTAHASQNGDSVRVPVIHLGGVVDLTPGERDIELRLSDDGLDIVRGRHETLGRLTWGEIRALTVPPIKGLRRRRRETLAHLVVRTAHGDASFEVPAVTPEELRADLAPMVERQGRAVEMH